MRVGAKGLLKEATASHVRCKSGNISETVPDGDKVTMKQ